MESLLLVITYETGPIEKKMLGCTRKKKRRNGEFRSTIALENDTLIGSFCWCCGVILPGKLFEDYGELS